jgi:nicotinamide mononucleotide transporter
MDVLANMVALLNAPAFLIWGATVSWAEVLGDVSGALCVWLVTRQHVLNWPIGLLNNVFWALLFWRAMLYADAALQGVFFGLGAYGWWNWVRGGTNPSAALPVRRSRRAEWLAIGGLTVPLTAALAWLLARHTHSPAPFWDASVLTLSIAATYGQTQKLVESWWLWILVDVISVPLYVSRALYPTALLYVVFGCLCVKGLLSWRRDLRLGEVLA